MDIATIQWAKRAVIVALDTSRDALHVHVGMAAYLLTSLLLRDRAGRHVALAVVVAVALLGEVLDYAFLVGQGRPWNARDSVQDVVNTTLWPLVLHALLLRPCGRGARR